METCFVIQPFDKGKYDQRFLDIFSPAITKAGLKPYRIDQDPSVRIPIEDIEKGITDSTICFAEISTDNPNVWYELGFAIASKKDVILVCADDREGPFPFDIRHRQVITYKTDSISDYHNLATQITTKITAFLESDTTTKKISESPVVATDGLNSQEIVVMVLVMQHQFNGDSSISLWTIRNEMQKSGYNDLGTSFALSTLTKKEMIQIIKDSDPHQYNDADYKGCILTEKGHNWMLDNESKFDFRLEPASKANSFLPPTPPEDEDLPF